MNIVGIGQVIKERRSFLKIDQRSLGELSGVAVHTISNIESGKGNPTIEVLNRIIAVLGMDLIVKVENES
jgi:transcriptional regulator with XRE-family HTH domain